MPNELESAAIGFGATVLTAATIWVKKWIADQRKEKSASAVIDAGKVYDVLNELATRVNADRVLILYTSNGGGIPTAGKGIYTTILYEVVKGEGLNPIRKDFQNVPLDGGYIKMLEEVVTSGFWRGEPSDLHDGFLKTLYESEKIKEAIVFEVARTEKQYFYASIRWKDHKPPSDATVDLAVTIAKSQLVKLVTAQ